MNKQKLYRVTFSRSGGRSHLPRARLFFNKFLAFIAASALTPSPLRVMAHRVRGVTFDDPRRVFIGEGVVLDRVFPSNIRIGKDVMLTSGSMIIAHYYEADYAGHVFRTGCVTVGDGVFFGARSLVVADVEIGPGAVIAAGAIVTDDVPAGTIVAGVPARKIGSRGPRPVTDKVPTLADFMK